MRGGELADSSPVSVRRADNRRLCVATPACLARTDTPRHPADLTRHEYLPLASDASQTRGWAFVVDGELKHLPLRLRPWIDFLKHTYGDTAYWARPATY